MDWGSEEVRRDQITLAEELLKIDPQVAAVNAYDIRDGILCTYSNIRGMGSVLVGPDLSVLFFCVLPRARGSACGLGRRKKDA